MRKIEQQMIDAIRQRKNWKKGNTEVRVVGNAEVHVWLHGNLIAALTFTFPFSGYPECIWISCAGWPTRTTCSRLRTLLATFCTRECGGYSVCIRNGCMRLTTPSGELLHSTLGDYALVCNRGSIGYLVAVS